MRNLILFSATQTNALVTKNIDATIYNGIDINETYYLGLIDNLERGLLEKDSRNGRFFAWGTHDGITVRQWEKIQPEDVVVGVSKWHFVFRGTVIFCRKNTKLGEFMWGHSEKNKPWEYIIFISNIQTMCMPVEMVYYLIGYRPNFAVRGLLTISHPNVANAIKIIEQSYY